MRPQLQDEDILFVGIQEPGFAQSECVQDGSGGPTKGTIGVGRTHVHHELLNMNISACVAAFGF